MRYDMVPRLRSIRECDFHPVRVRIRGTLGMLLRSIVENKRPLAQLYPGWDLGYRISAARRNEVEAAVRCLIDKYE